jgi:chemotaxis protein MotB
MARRRRQQHHTGHERWLVSYADFITLLFAFFVVMYAVSSVNEGKYRVLSDSLNVAFHNPMRTLDPLQVGELARVQAQPPAVAAEPPVALPQPPDAGPPPADPPPETPAQAVGTPMALLDAVAQSLERSLQPLIDQDLVEVRREADWLEVEMKTSILFSSGSATLVGEAIPVLTRVSEILKGFPNPIQVEGFTDNVPIRNSAFPSNWELSAGRAASVVHLFTRLGVRADRMLAIGYGEHRPVADNATNEGRARNRRVVIVIPAQGSTRRYVDLHRATAAAGLEVGP